MIFASDEVRSWVAELRLQQRADQTLRHWAEGLCRFLNCDSVRIDREAPLGAPRVVVASVGLENLSTQRLVFEVQSGGQKWWLELRGLGSTPVASEVSEINQLVLDHLKRLDLEMAYHRLEKVDELTGLAHSHHLKSEVASEVQRSRRIYRPVTLLALELVPQGGLASLKGLHQAEQVALLRTVGRAIRRRSRQHDLIGHWGSCLGLGVLLPHTSHLGGLIKAERLRRMIQSADFSRLIESHPRWQLAVGLAEYPTMCRDADELWELSERARETSLLSPQLSVSSVEPNIGFVPDFNSSL